MKEFPITTCSLSEDSYPVLLQEISDAPERLFFRGALPGELLAVGIVGTRRASREGRALARELGEALSRAGVAVVSGLAFGIDAAAHEGALKGTAPTFAVLGCGVAEVYPQAHSKLADDILAHGGGVLSEYEPKRPALQHQFLARNRIISGLCRAVVLIEVPRRSGALSTAAHALRQGRDVLVFPGSAKDSKYAGSHFLLREGARAVTSAEQVLEDIGHCQSDLFQQSFSFASEEELMVYNVLQSSGERLTVDNIVETTRLEPHRVQHALTLLIISGAVKEHSDAFFV